MSFDMSQVVKHTIANKDELAALWLDNYPEDGSSCIVALDAETSGLDFPSAQLRSVQLYFPQTLTALYVPLAAEPTEGRMTYADFIEVLNAEAETTEFYFYNASFDLRFLIREGAVFYEIRDAAIINTALQHSTMQLKHLVAELGLVNFMDIMTWSKLVQLAKDRGILPQAATDSVDFGLLEANLPEAIDYALADPIYTWLVYQPLYDQYVVQFGAKEDCDTTLRWQFDTQLVLAESEARGYTVDLPQLEASVELKQVEYDQEDQAIIEECRRILGWATPEPVQPISRQASLFDLVDELKGAGARA